MSPFANDDLTEVVVPRGKGFVVLRSPETAEHDPDYVEIAAYGTDLAVEAPPTAPI